MGGWVVAKYGNHSFVGNVKAINAGEFTVQFLRKKSLYFVYPNVEDILDI